MTNQANLTIVVSKKDPTSIKTFEEAIREIDAGLENLKALTNSTNFTNADERQIYKDNITFLKQFYECAERVTLS